MEDFCKYAGKPCRTKENAEERALEKDMRAYLCESCDTYHLTSRPKREWIESDQEPQEIDYD